MQRMIYKIFIIIMLLICSISLVSCKAITAQNITNTTSNQGMMNGGAGGPGGQGMIGSTRNDKITMADLTGKILSIDGNSIKIQLAEQTQNNKSQNSDSKVQNTNSNQSKGTNRQFQRGFSGSVPQLSYTNTTKTITVNDSVNISQRTMNVGRQNKNDNSKSTIKVSDLKKGEVIMVWYKANTETVERINVVQY